MCIHIHFVVVSNSSIDLAISLKQIVYIVFNHSRSLRDIASNESILIIAIALNRPV